MALRAESSAVVEVSWDSSSPRVRCVAARSERSWARDGVSVDAAVTGDFPLPLGVSGRMVFVEAVGVVASSS